MKKPNPTYAPVYCIYYPGLSKLAREYGYGVAVHGSMQRDFDMICIPWIDEAKDPQTVVDAICDTFNFETVGDVTNKPHGRMVYALQPVGGKGVCFDLGFMPRK